MDLGFGGVDHPSGRVDVLHDVLFNRGRDDKRRHFTKYEDPHPGQAPGSLDLVEACNKIKRAYPEYQERRRLQKGAYGQAFVLCKTLVSGGRLCDLVLKEQTLNDEFRNEVQTMESVKGDMRFSQIVDSFTCRGKGLILMERLEKCEERPERHEALLLLEVMYARGFLHMDNHSDNVMCRREEDDAGRKVDRPVLIDFGLALNLDFPNQHRLVWHKMKMPRLEEGRGGDWRFWAWSYQCMLLNEDRGFQGNRVSEVRGGPYRGEGFEQLDPETPGPQELAIKHVQEMDRGGHRTSELRRLRKMLNPRYLRAQNVLFFDTTEGAGSYAPFDWRRAMSEYQER